jgi:hypothetical protein
MAGRLPRGGLPRKQTQAAVGYALTYRTDRASDTALSQPQQCETRFPSAQGVSFQDPGDAG